MAVSLRIPDDVKKRVDKLAAESDTTTHAFMLQAIREKVEADEARSAFHAQAEQRLAAMKRSGKGIPADKTFDYLRERARGKHPGRPKAIKAA